MRAFLVSSGLSLESKASTLIWRPAKPPCLLIQSAKPLTASTEPWKSPGASGVLISATTAIRISVADMPTSVALPGSPVVVGPDVVTDPVGAGVALWWDAHAPSTRRAVITADIGALL